EDRGSGRDALGCGGRIVLSAAPLRSRRRVERFARVGAPIMYKHILAATDFSQLGDQALQKATQLAVQLGAKLTLVHVMVSEDSASPMYAQHEVRAHVEKLKERLPEHASEVKVELEVRVGVASTEILAAAE